MQHGITIIEFLISLALMLLVVPCIVNSSLKDYKMQAKSKISFLNSLDYSAKNCKEQKYNNINLLKCKDKNNEIFYKIK